MLFGMRQRYKQLFEIWLTNAKKKTLLLREGLKTL